MEMKLVFLLKSLETLLNWYYRFCIKLIVNRIGRSDVHFLNQSIIPKHVFICAYKKKISDFF